MKSLGFAGFVSAILLLVGSGLADSASATVLCKNSTSPCTTPYSAGEHLNLRQTETQARLTASPEVVCKKGEWTILVTKNTGGTVTGDVISAISAECKTGETACTVQAGGLPWHVEVHVVGSGPNGTFTWHGLEYLVVCAGFLNCTFGNSAVTLPVTGGSTATVTFNAVALSKVSGFLCPSSAKLDAAPTISNLWVRP